MKQNYRRTITSWLRQIETEIIEVRDAIDHPRTTPLLAQRIVGSREQALASIDDVLKLISEITERLGLSHDEVDVVWSAYVQLLAAEISVGELLPDRRGGVDAVGDEAEAAEVEDLLHRLLAQLREARTTLNHVRGVHNNP